MKNIMQKLCILIIAMVAFVGSISVYAGIGCVAPLCVEKYVMNNGVKIFARDWGPLLPNRPTILFVHGFPHSDTLWQNQVISALSVKYRIITVDLRGHGASDKPTDPLAYDPSILANDIKAVLDGFSVKKAVLVGHSYGGAPITDFSFYGNNSRIAGLVYVDASPALNDQLAGVPADAFAAVVQTLPTPSGDPTLANFVAGNNTFASLTFSPQVAPVGAARDLLGSDYLVQPAVRAALLNGEPPAFTAQMDAYTAGLVTLQKIPVLVVWGDADRIVAPSVFQNLAAHIVGSKPVVYANQGHVPQLTKSAQFNIDLDNFISNFCK